MTIIGLVGRAESGKDTTARLIREQLTPESPGDSPPECYVFRFADTLKTFVGHVFDWDEDWTHGAKKEEPDPRYDRTASIQMQRERDFKLIQDWFAWMGEDIDMRGEPVDTIIEFLDTKHAEGYYGPDYLTSRYAQQHIGTEGVRWCWPDAWVQLTIRQVQKLAADAIVILVDVRFQNEAQAVLDGGGVLWRTTRRHRDASGDVHVSETEVDSIRSDFILDNNGSLEDLRAQVAQALGELLQLRDPLTGVYSRDFVGAGEERVLTRLENTRDLFWEEKE